MMKNGEISNICIVLWLKNLLVFSSVVMSMLNVMLIVSMLFISSRVFSVLGRKLVLVMKKVKFFRLMKVFLLGYSRL